MDRALALREQMGHQRRCNKLWFVERTVQSVYLEWIKQIFKVSDIFYLFPYFSLLKAQYLHWKVSLILIILTAKHNAATEKFLTLTRKHGATTEKSLSLSLPQPSYR